MVSRRFREMAGLPRVAITEEMAQAIRKNGKWTDGTYTDGDSITMHGQGMNIEFEPDPGHLTSDTGQPVDGAWYAINNDGDEIEFDPGMEDRHDSMVEPEQMFPEDVEDDTGTDEMAEIISRCINDFINGSDERVSFGFEDRLGKYIADSLAEREAEETAPVDSGHRDWD